LIDDILIADATAHAYNWTQENMRIPEAAGIIAGGFGFHQFLSTDPELMLEESEFKRDWPSQDVSDTLFYEAGVDFICHHGTPIYDFFHDGHSANEKGYELQERFGDRVITYAAINPFELDAAQTRAKVDEFVDEHGTSGLKVYGARYANGKTFDQRLDDPQLAFPMIERAIERGVKVIATHKAIPVGPVRYDPWGLTDLPEACAQFPEINFEIVHTGFAFVEASAFLAAFPNCYFNLETSFALINRAPRRFAEFLAALLAGGAGDRVFYSSGMSLIHPLGALKAFMEFEMPQDLVEGFGCPPLTRELKAKILGENFLLMHGIDPQALKAKIADDEVSQRQAKGLETPWSNVRANMAAEA
jgi:hypothetical protein